MKPTELVAKSEEYREKIDRVRAEVSKAIVGHDDVLEQVIICLLCDGHALVEGVPGLGKTSLIRALGDAMHLKTSRVQFTPDLMPADIIGTDMLVEGDGGAHAVRFAPGPLFTQVLLADEINRATPKTQSALLEAMQEHRVTVGGKTYQLEAPFIVLATQNPIEMEGTYPLPEAQLDRFFFKLSVQYPSRSDIHEILERTTTQSPPEISPILDADEISEIKMFVRGIPVPEVVRDYAVNLVMATHPEESSSIDHVKKYVRYGSSPRGAQSLILSAKCMALMDGRFNAGFDDVRRSAFPALRHRIIVGFEAEAEGIGAEDILESIVTTVETANL